MRFMVKGIFCLPDDEYQIDKACDGQMFYWFERFKKLIELGAPEVILYNEVTVLLQDRLAKLSNRKQIAVDLGCRPDEVERVVKDNLLKLKTLAPPDEEINKVRSTVCERITKAVKCGELPKSALNNLDQVKVIDVIVSDKATTTQSYIKKDFGIVLPLTAKFNRADLSHELLHAVALAVDNPIWRSLERFLITESKGQFASERGSPALEFCELLSEYVCEVMLNRRYFEDYIYEETDESEADVFTDTQLSCCDKYVEMFGEQILYGLYFGEILPDIKRFIDFISADLGKDAWICSESED